MLRAECPPELDAVETHELGLSIAFPKEQGECVERQAESKITGVKKSGSTHETR